MRISRQTILWIVMGIVLILLPVVLRLEGRVWWCACGGWNPWAGDIWSAHNSQHVLDPYSFTHVLHGILFFWIIWWVGRRWPVGWRLTLTVFLEAGWEVVENSTFIIHRYREATIGLGYEGDSIVNSFADMACCCFGFWLALRLGFLRSLAVLLVVELVLLFWVRDNLTLNILMLTFPIDAVKQWQMGL